VLLSREFPEKITKILVSSGLIRKALSFVNAIN
jgi:hypothetical protein